MRRAALALLAALDEAPGTATLFLRDDDAGWADAALFALLDCVARLSVPIDLAVIPAAASRSLANVLCARFDDHPDRLGIHQHGLSHTNHQPCGRKCEFGSARCERQQTSDLVTGRSRLRDLFGTRVDPIFTPPWNRCGIDTPRLLAELGYAALSRDCSAPSQAYLPQISVTLDWCKLRRTAQAGPIPFEESVCGALAEQIRLARDTGSALGLMLHHAQMDARDRALLMELLTVLALHPRARFVAMRALCAAQPAVPISDHRVRMENPA